MVARHFYFGTFDAAPSRGVHAITYTRVRKTGATSVTTLLAVVTGVDTEGCKVLLEDGGVVVYGTLVLATGARHAYFGHNEWNLTRPVSRHYRKPPPFAAGYFFPLNRPNVRPIRSVAPRCSPL